MLRTTRRIAGATVMMAALAFSLLPIPASAAASAQGGGYAVARRANPGTPPGGNPGTPNPGNPLDPWIPPAPSNPGTGNPGLTPGFPWLPPGFGNPGNPWQPPGGGIPGNPPPTNPSPNPGDPGNPPPTNPGPNPGNPGNGGGNGQVPDGFPAQFQTPDNAVTHQPVKGWGCDPTGQTDGGAVKHTPILFIHGATRDAHDFDQDRQYFLNQGYSPCELWAVSWGYGTQQNPETNDASYPTVQAFVKSMLNYIQQYKNSSVSQIDIVTHSMGGTVVRKWLYTSGDTKVVHSFVEIAAPNHGIDFCQGGTNMAVCNEIAPGSAWLNELNSKGETPDGVRTMTIYDGTGQDDQFYQGSLKDSPMLKGATNHPYNVENGTSYDHEGLIDGTEALQLDWLKNDFVAAK